MHEADLPTTRRFAAGRAELFVRCPSIEVRDAVERLLVDLPTGDRTDDPSVVVIEADGERLNLKVDGQGMGDFQEPSITLARLVTAISRLALDADPEHLHLHAAALAKDGRAVLISAASGTGKTTLAAGLATAGWTYLTDEAVELSRSGTAVTGFPKPLTIKPGGGDLVRGLETARVGFDPTERWWNVPVSAIGAAVSTSIEPAVLVVLHRVEDGSTDAPAIATSIHPVDAVVAMMSQTMDSERFGDDALEVLARLAARCRCVSMSVGPIATAVEVIDGLVREGATVPTVEELEPNRSAVPAPWEVGHRVRSCLIGDRAVLYETSSRAIVALDDAGTALWLALNGHPPSWWKSEILAAPTSAPFLDQLNALGFLDRADATKASP